MLTEITYQEEICQIALGVFSSMLNAEVSQILPGANWSLPFELEAEVSICGEWKGSLVLRCTWEQARAWARRLLPMEPQEDDVLDAVGEIANMIGGNVKAILPPRNALGTPIVRATVGIVGPTHGANVNSLVILH